MQKEENDQMISWKEMVNKGLPQLRVNRNTWILNEQVCMKITVLIRKGNNIEKGPSRAGNRTAAEIILFQNIPLFTRTVDVLYDSH